MPADLRSWIRLVVLAGALVLGAWVRLRGLADLPLSGDEYHTLMVPQDGERVDLGVARYGAILTTFDSVGSHVALPLLQRLSMSVFGTGIVPFRLVAIVPGLLFLLLLYPALRAMVGRDEAALATALLALNPMTVYYARFARGYALGMLLALGLGWAVWRLREPLGRTRATWGVLVGSAALLPWVHLSTLGFVLALALCAVGLAARESRALAGRMVLAFAAAGVVTFLLFLPSLGQVLEFFRGLVPESPPLTWFGVPTLIAGSPVAAWIWLASLPLGALALWRERRETVWLASASLLGPLAFLLLSKPRGMDYAWARYLLSTLPFLAALIAAAALSAARFVPRVGAPLILVLGSGLCAWQLWESSLGPRSPRDGSFSHTYLALHPLPAFDEPYSATPAFYRTLARDSSARRIVEMPPLYTRSVLLYRNYALQHGKDVLIGWTGEMPSGIRNGPYTRLLGLGPEQADYIVIHKDQTTEVPEYFRFVLEEAWPRMHVPADETFMRRQEAFYPQYLLAPETMDPIVAKLREVYGEPGFEDERIVVFRTGP